MLQHIPISSTTWWGHACSSKDVTQGCHPKIGWFTSTFGSSQNHYLSSSSSVRCTRATFGCNLHSCCTQKWTVIGFIQGKAVVCALLRCAPSQHARGRYNTRTELSQTVIVSIYRFTFQLAILAFQQAWRNSNHHIFSVISILFLLKPLLLKRSEKCSYLRYSHFTMLKWPFFCLERVPASEKRWYC